MTPSEILSAKLPGAKESANVWSARCRAYDDRKRWAFASTMGDAAVPADPAVFPNTVIVGTVAPAKPRPRGQLLRAKETLFAISTCWTM